MLLGVSRLYEPCGWLFSADDVLAELVDRSIGLKQPMVLQRIPAGSAVVARLRAVPRYRALTIARATAPALGVVTTGSWDEYYASLSSQVTANLPRVRRKAEVMLGPLTYVQQDPAPAEVDALLETLVAVEGSGWKGRQGTSLGSRPELGDFFRRYCHRAAAKRRLRVSTLSFGSQIAAVELSIEAYARLWQLKIGYDESVASYYPGLQLTVASIRAAFDRGLDSYEFLGSAAAWEERLRPETRRYQTLGVYPVTAPGLAGVCREAAHAGWRHARRAGAGVVARVRDPRRGSPVPSA